MDLVAHLGAQCGDRRVVEHFDLARFRDACRISHHCFGELVDEDVFLQQPGADAVRHVELRRGQPLRLVRPADVVHRHLGTVDHHFFHVLGGEGAFVIHLAQRVERGVVTADAGVELQRDAHGLPHFTETGGEFLQVELVGRLRHRRAEAAVRVLQHVDDPGEAAFGKQRPVEAGLRGAACMHALDHRTELRRHQARSLGAGNAQRVYCFVDIEFQAARSTCSGGEHAQRSARMPAGGDVRRAHAQANARADFITGDGGGEEFLAAHARFDFGDRDQRGQYDCAHMQHAGAMHVVEFKALHLRAVDQRGMRCGEFFVGAPHAALAGAVDAAQLVLQDAGPLKVGTIERAAQRIQHQQLVAMTHFFRDLVVSQTGNERGDVAGVGMGLRRLLGHGADSCDGCIKNSIKTNSC